MRNTVRTSSSRLGNASTPSFLNVSESAIVDQSHTRVGSTGNPSIFASSLPMTEEVKTGRSPSILMESVQDRESMYGERESMQYGERRASSRERRRGRRDYSARPRRRRPEEEGGWTTTSGGVRTHRVEQKPDSDGYIHVGNMKGVFDTATGKPRPGSTYFERIPDQPDPFEGCYPTEERFKRVKEEGEREVKEYIQTLRDAGINTTNPGRDFFGIPTPLGQEEPEDPPLDFGLVDDKMVEDLRARIKEWEAELGPLVPSRDTPADSAPATSMMGVDDAETNRGASVGGDTAGGELSTVARLEKIQVRSPSRFGDSMSVAGGDPEESTVAQ
uniref:Uncharacterized protein n=2 Tax=Amorphochlora amoebiformis TaxID=1561963 RepID=A0A7S0DT19_9EUKA